ncbi:helix-turn-helix transcriptional regulator [bacterium]|nr:helix-turn-helix transcriptional regulator [bacterium]MBP3847240.1 helix-turn-helix transcriptional regulator [bacterium]
MDLKDLPKNPIAVTIKMVGCRWKVMIVAELLGGTKRFNEIKKSLKGITQKVLTSKLRELEQDEILTRETEGSKVSYTLTDIGYSLRPVILSFYDWGKDYKKYVKLMANR